VRARRVSVWVCAMIAFGAVSGAFVFHPAAVFAASGMVSVETPLHDSADPAAPVIALLPEGTIVSIDGPPVAGFYPVSAGDQSGWLRGEAVQVEKGTPALDSAEDMAGAPPVDETNEAMPLSEPVPADTLTPGNEPEAVDATAATPAHADTDDVTPMATTPDGAVPLPDSTAPTTEVAVEPAIDVTATPLSVPEVAAVGPANVITEAPILAGPGPEYGFIATVPAGSTVEQTGHVINGYATVQYAEVTGWLALEHLGAPGTVLGESPLGETAAPVEKLPADAPPAESPPSGLTQVESPPNETAP
jgi:hypothetical protein